MARNYVSQESDATIAQGVLDALDEMGYSDEENLGGLLYALSLIAERSEDPSACLDECADIITEWEYE